MLGQPSCAQILMPQARTFRKPQAVQKQTCGGADWGIKLGKLLGILEDLEGERERDCVIVVVGGAVGGVDWGIKLGKLLGPTVLEVQILDRCIPHPVPLVHSAPISASVQSLPPSCAQRHRASG